VLRNLYTTAPVSYPHRGKRDRRVLNLTEIAILRRVAKKERASDIRRVLTLGASEPRATLRQLRVAFDVNTNDELLAHPDVIRQIKEED
jgi:hypothetical protein